VNTVEKDTNLLHLPSMIAMGNVPRKSGKKEEKLCFKNICAL